MMKFVTFAIVLISAVLAVQAQETDFCLQCTSSISDTACNDPEGQTHNFLAKCVQASSGQCFSRIDQAGNLERGCAGRLDNATRNACDGETCQLCQRVGGTESGCNDQVFPQHRLRCHICTGGADTDCAGRTNTTMTVCPIFRADDRCYVARPNRNFERGCLSSATVRCGDGEACHICEGQGCNFEDFNSAMSIFSVAKLIPFVFMSIALAVFNN